uniref:CX domain-containing protein n=1 Tax=Caenorhabditis tropicalis TaxID=1561998 RepID=A0A1I7SZ66_9PELO
MLNIKLLALCVVFISVAYITAGDAGTGNAKKALTGKEDGQKFCPPDSSQANALATCPDPGFAWHYTCCNDDKECCFAFEVWVFVVFGVLLALIIMSIILTICCCCCKK